ncbi:hypothetical protein BDZ90DRAFT_232157 [Jaminaea rosea]|uniref:SWIRM-domain-containing protein n=1 Tax=Jaminaea rosea TaxID=1569628 RepID=A0A316UV14_9BASI|nr:hypothetical protein BDZ90DRAFT_232157 [Jaminaea rosea]PWN27763.1 hypothetical protein BDZ90DRAFT_232157 [Jaminaea rosea]
MSLSVSGRPPATLRDDATIRARLATILPNLEASLSNAGLSAPTASSTLSVSDVQALLYNLQLYQHDVLGPDAAKRPANPDSSNALARHPPRIPASCFRTTSSLASTDAAGPSSPVFVVLEAALLFLAKRGDKSTDVDVARVDNTELVAAIRSSLRERGHIKRFKVTTEGDFTEAEKASLQRMAESLECEWTADASGATHVLHPSTTPPASPGGSGAMDYHRTLARAGSQALIHVWYRPDSYDTWVPAAGFAEPEPEPEVKSRWDLESRWLRDGVRYNECMNEEDYELSGSEAGAQDAAATTSGTLNIGDQGAASTTASTSTKRGRPLPDEVDDDAASSEDAGTSKKIKIFVAAKPVGAVPIDLTGGAASIPGKVYEKEALPGGVIGNLPSEPAPVAADVSMQDDDDDEEEEPDAPPSAAAIALEHRKATALAKRYLAAQTQEIIIPSYSTWFSFNAISPLERRSLPEFFNGRNRSKTPEIYKDYRDFMVNTYRLNPSEYLTFTACRRNLAGDVCSIMRVHGFLEQWGLINYQIDPDTRPAALGPPFTGHFRVLVDSPRGLQPLHPGTKSETRAQPAPQSQSQPQRNAGSSLDVSLELRRTVYSTTLRASRQISAEEGASLAQQADKARANGAGASSSYQCDTCGSDCTSTRYASIKNKDYALCPGCYTDGRFPSSMFSGDFVRVDEAAFKHGKGGEEWSDAETLRLLEALEMYGDDWARVEEHVGTRGSEECIQRFVQLPVEEPYLGGAGGKQSDLGALQYLRDPKALGGNTVPFSQSDNPVMSVVAFLASAVSPAVASAAAQSALGELTEGLKKRVGAGEGEKAEEGGEKGEKGEKEAATDGMDLDKEGEDSSAAAAAASGPVEVTVTDAAKASSAMPRSAVERAASIALGAAASKAYVLASFEERECQRLVKQVIEAQMRKMELKMRQFEDLEALLESERRQLEVSRRELYADRLKVQRQLRQVHELMRKAQHTQQAHARAYEEAQRMGTEMQPPPSVEGVTQQDMASVGAGVQEGQGASVREVREVPAPQGGSIGQL